MLWLIWIGLMLLTPVVAGIRVWRQTHSGAPDARWNNDALLRELGAVKGADFEVVRMQGLVKP